MNGERLSSLIQGIPPSGIRKFFDLIIGRNDIISLGVGACGIARANRRVS